MKDEEIKGRFIKFGASSILGTIGIGTIWSIYNALDNRIRANELSITKQIPVIERMSVDVQEIKKDVKVILRTKK